ncbi:hypothetical protein DERP_007417 [Dermatophagoides pteronyssinus]|uniref:Uncharacterized protein n=1 Tax=Dermatophagoides pteronyssinus TaxID=6956 RepID=A0ABQ8J4B3_DERPT|nr:hypothetical protein DERP_007417 [Dermatophagoides pteronyssinus]
MLFTQTNLMLPSPMFPPASPPAPQKLIKGGGGGAWPGRPGLGKIIITVTSELILYLFIQN